MLRVVESIHRRYFIPVLLITASIVSSTACPTFSVHALSMGTQATYGGTVLLPGRVEFRNYDTLGEGLAYHDLDAVNLGGVYRPNEGVDLADSAAEGIPVVAWVQAGEWLKYTVTVSTTSTYRFQVRVANGESLWGIFHIEVDGLDKTGPMVVPATGGWEAYQTITKTGISLTSGDHTLNVVMDANGGMFVGNFAWVDILADNRTGAACPPNSFFVSVSGNDGNPGTQSAPWRTIGKAVATLTAGQTACVTDGTYEEPLVEFKTHDGTAAAPITLKAQNQWGAILSSLAGTTPAISVSASYITIDGLRINISPNHVPFASLQNSAHVPIRGWAPNVPTTGSPSAGRNGLVIRNLKVDRGQAWYEGIKTNIDDTLIENSSLGSGGANAVDVNNFIVRNNDLYNDNTGGGAQQCMEIKGGARNARVYNNVCHYLGGERGVVVGGSGVGGNFAADGVELYNTVFFDNVIINESGNTDPELLGMRASKDCLILNNVVIGGRLYMYQGTSVNTYPNSPYNPMNPTWLNNIVVANGQATSPLSTWLYQGTLTMDYNDFYGFSSGVPGQTHAVTGNPNFVNITSDWHLQAGSPAIGTGAAITSWPAYGGGILDTSKNKDATTRTVPWSLGLY